MVGVKIKRARFHKDFRVVLCSNKCLLYEPRHACHLYIYIYICGHMGSGGQGAQLSSMMGHLDLGHFGGGLVWLFRQSELSGGFRGQLSCAF